LLSHDPLPEGGFRWNPSDHLLFAEMVCQCGTFNAHFVPGGWQCLLQVYSQWPYVSDLVWQRLTAPRPEAPEAHWTTITNDVRLRAIDSDNSPQFLRGLRMQTKGSTRAFASYLRGLDAPWREAAWREWAAATDLYGRAPRDARRMAIIRLKYALEREPPMKLIDWFVSKKIIKPEK
jgi:hypothetical protein